MANSSNNFRLTVEERKRGKIGVITMDLLPPNNTFNKELLLAFADTLYEFGKEVDAVLVTSANPKFFSNGLDGKFLLESDANTRRDTIFEMIRLFGKLIRFPKPWAVELGGYAMAGGAVISAAADYRYMTTAGVRIGFSELAVGLPLPLVYIHGIHRIVNPVAVRDLIEGNSLKPEEALAVGLVDGIAETPEKLRAMCLKRLDAVLRLEQLVYLPTRELYRKDLLRLIERDEPEDIRMAGELIKLPVLENVLRTIAGKNR